MLASKTMPRPIARRVVGTLDRIAIVRTSDYWQSVAATLTPDWAPRFPGVLVLHVVSATHFEEVRRQLAETSLYYAANWRLERVA